MNELFRYFFSFSVLIFQLPLFDFICSLGRVLALLSHSLHRQVAQFSTEPTVSNVQTGLEVQRVKLRMSLNTGTLQFSPWFIYGAEMGAFCFSKASVCLLTWTISHCFIHGPWIVRSNSWTWNPKVSNLWCAFTCIILTKGINSVENIPQFPSFPAARRFCLSSWTLPSRWEERARVRRASALHPWVRKTKSVIRSSASAGPSSNECSLINYSNWKHVFNR